MYNLWIYCLDENIVDGTRMVDGIGGIWAPYLLSKHFGKVQLMKQFHIYGMGIYGIVSF